MKRLNGLNQKSDFYKANVHLGRIYKTIFMLEYLSDKEMRSRARKGLLKGEQLHQLARNVTYGNQGKMKPRTWDGQKQICNALNMILAAIIYWQANEMNKLILNCDDPSIDLTKIKHISPIKWKNITLYGEYNIDINKIKN